MNLRVLRARFGDNAHTTHKDSTSNTENEQTNEWTNEPTKEWTEWTTERAMQVLWFQWTMLKGEQ